jgi:hypothetical protein
MMSKRFVISGGLALLISANPIAATAQSCVVNDPTGTPLNIRVLPGGTVLSTLANGAEVTVLSRTTHNGKTWVYIATGSDKMPSGRVFQDYLLCDSSGRR